MNDPIKRIVALVGGSDCRSKDSFEYAFYLTVSMSDLCKYFFQYVMDTEVRNNIIKHINAKKEKKDEKIPKEFISTLLKEFKLSEKRRRISLGAAIKEFSSSFSKKQLKEFFNNQVMSRKLSDRKRAYSVCQDIYDQDIDNKLWESWKIYRDNNCMDVLSKNTISENIIPHFNEIWADENIRFYIKNNALKKVAVSNIEAVDFLKEESPVSYLSACVAAKHEINDELAKSIAKQSDKISTLNYVLWCLGMLGKEKILCDLLDQITDIEKNIPHETWEYNPVENA